MEKNFNIDFHYIIFFINVAIYYKIKSVTKLFSDILKNSIEIIQFQYEQHISITYNKVSKAIIY